VCVWFQYSHLQAEYLWQFGKVTIVPRKPLLRTRGTLLLEANK
jgi:hypothetical protein